MKQRSFSGRGAFAAATALLLASGLAVQPVPARAETYNACRVYYDGLHKKIKDGKALVARGFLKIEKDGPDAFLSLRNEKGSCDVMLETYPGETEYKQGLKCGNGASVSIIGAFKSAFGLPGIDPATISCN